MDKSSFDDLPDEELSAIVDYLNGELTGEELEAFEQRLASDSGWRAKVLEVKALFIGIREENLRTRLDNYHPQAVDKPVEPRKSVPFTWTRWVAASVAVAALAGMWWLWPTQPSHDELFREYFVADAGLPVAMSGADTLQYAFYDGMISYKEGDYSGALSKWDALASEVSPSDTLRYYQGIAHLASGHLDEAIGLLTAVAHEPASAFNEDANWYLALCYLQRGERGTASGILGRIPDRESASELRKKLE